METPQPDDLQDPDSDTAVPRTVPVSIRLPIAALDLMAILASRIQTRQPAQGLPSRTQLLLMGLNALDRATRDWRRVQGLAFRNRLRVAPEPTPLELDDIVQSMLPQHKGRLYQITQLEPDLCGRRLSSKSGFPIDHVHRLPAEVRKMEPAPAANGAIPKIPELEMPPLPTNLPRHTGSRDRFKVGDYVRPAPKYRAKYLYIVTRIGRAMGSAVLYGKRVSGGQIGGRILEPETLITGRIVGEAPTTISEEVT